MLAKYGCLGTFKMDRRKFNNEKLWLDVEIPAMIIY